MFTLVTLGNYSTNRQLTDHDVIHFLPCIPIPLIYPLELLFEIPKAVFLVTVGIKYDTEVTQAVC